MLTADQFDILTDDVMSLYSDYETSVIADIARRLSRLSLGSVAWQVQRLTESGALYQDVLEKLSKLTGQSTKQIAETLQRAGVKAINFDDKIYKEAGLNPIPLNLSPAMLDTLKAVIEKTNGTIHNITMTTAVNAQHSFIYAADIAHQQVATGAMSYDQAITQAIKNVAAKGLRSVDFMSGKVESLDVAMRRAVLTGVGQTAHRLQWQRADELGSDLVAVSAHAGARNKGVGPENHQSWQGKIYSRSGTSKKYPSFIEKTGFGTVTGLGCVNCHHSYYPYFEGISENAYSRKELTSLNNQKVKYQDKEISLYDAKQIQREIERKIRYWKRQKIALEAGGINSSNESEKVSYWQSQMRSFIKETDLNREYIREQVFHG